MTAEQAEVLGTFTELLRAATADGGRKRATGLKPSWKVDLSHEAAIFSHLNKWKHGERKDPDSGSHPLVHMAWRALAIAWQESTMSEPQTNTSECLLSATPPPLLPTELYPPSPLEHSPKVPWRERAHNRILD